MRIAKPMLLVSTPIGLGLGIYEGYRLAGGLVFLMVALIALISVAMGTVVATVRRERRAELAAQAAAGGSEEPDSSQSPRSTAQNSVQHHSGGTRA